MKALKIPQKQHTTKTLKAGGGSASAGIMRRATTQV